jgi:hypothetical protein
MPITHLTDFSDRLSPMLVKELRQGMRARSFTMLFLIFQLLLAFILLTAGSSTNSEDSGSIASGVIFTMFSIAVLFIQPMRGLSALSVEIKGNTIEMMALTRLTASRIVFGKWIAIVSQSALLLITIIPYLILRYFYGGMMLLAELVSLTLIFLTSMALTALMVGLSGTSTKIIRALPVFAFIGMMYSLPVLLFGSSSRYVFGSLKFSSWESQVAVLAYLSFITYIGWCALSYGISAIAPQAENHSTLRRIIALVLACTAAAVGQHHAVDPRATLAIFGIILAPAIITALTEHAVPLPPICKPFLKRGLLGRCSSLFLLPGWPAGAFYSALLLLISILGTWLTEDPTDIKIGTAGWTVCLAFTGAVIFPALLATFFTKQPSKRFTNFIIFTLISVVLTVLPAIFANANNHESYLWLFIWNPPVALVMVDESGINASNLLMAIIVVDALYLSLLLVKAGAAYRGYRGIFQEAKNDLTAAVTPNLS